MIELDELVKSANTLDPLPQTVTRLMQLLANEDVNVDEIEKVFASDGALTARLLRQANSASSGSRNQIGTISSAIVRLGLGSVMALAVSVSTQKELSTSLPEYGIGEGGMWKHAQAARLAAEAMRRFCKIQIPPEAPTAALLHDIGKIVMARALGPELEVLKQAKPDDDAISMELEQEVLEVHHGELGGLIAQNWQLPDMIVHGIIHHHNPDACTGEDNTICHIVCFANWAAHAADLKARQQPYPAPSDTTVAKLGIQTDRIDELLDKVVEAVDNLGY